MKTQEEIEQLAIKYSNRFIIDQPFIKDMFVEVYTQCQEDMAIQTISNGKRRIAPFKQDSMNVVWENGYHIGYFDTEEDAFHAIQKWEVEIVDGKLKLK